MNIFYQHLYFIRQNWRIQASYFSKRYMVSEQMRWSVSRYDGQWADAMVSEQMRWSVNRCDGQWADATVSEQMRRSVNRCDGQWTDAMVNEQMRWSVNKCDGRWADAMVSEQMRWSVSRWVCVGFMWINWYLSRVSSEWDPCQCCSLGIRTQVSVRSMPVLLARDPNTGLSEIHASAARQGSEHRSPDCQPSTLITQLYSYTRLTRPWACMRWNVSSESLSIAASTRIVVILVPLIQNYVSN